MSWAGEIPCFWYPWIVKVQVGDSATASSSQKTVIVTLEYRKPHSQRGVSAQSSSLIAFFTCLCRH